MSVSSAGLLELTVTWCRANPSDIHKCNFRRNQREMWIYIIFIIMCMFVNFCYSHTERNVKCLGRSYVCIMFSTCSTLYSCCYHILFKTFVTFAEWAAGSNGLILRRFQSDELGGKEPILLNLSFYLVHMYILSSQRKFSHHQFALTDVCGFFMHLRSIQFSLITSLKTFHSNSIFYNFFLSPLFVTHLESCLLSCVHVQECLLLN